MAEAPHPQVWPSLRAHDAHRLIEFLVDVLGFEVSALFADGDIVEHAQLAWPEGGGVMLGSDREDPADVWGLTPGTAGCYVVTNDPGTVADRASAAGAVIARALHETEYGSREVTIIDPEGNRWSFGTYRGEPV